MKNADMATNNGKILSTSEFMLIVTMIKTPERAIFTVVQNEGLWSVEHDGQYFGVSADKEIAMAAANRQVRELQDSGRPCRVRVAGEPGFWTER